MKKFFVILATFALSLGLQAQTARQILDKTAAVVQSYTTASAGFVATSKQGNMSGTIILQGKKFAITSASANIWFDGATMWSMQHGSGEVNVTTPTAAELQRMNPYTFLNLYKSGYNLTAKASGNNNVVTMTAQKPGNGIQSMVVTINKTTNLPSKVVMTSKNSSVTISINNVKKIAKKADGYFKFDKKKYPKVEIIDLR